MEQMDLPCTRSIKITQHQDTNMNERLEKLAVKANLKTDEFSDDVFIPLENFIELLIKDLANSADSYVAMKVGPGVIGSLLKKQYGIN
jgi:hypothetical protein